MKNEFVKFVTYSRNQGRFSMLVFGLIVFFFVLDQIRDVSLFDMAFNFGKHFYAEWGLPFIFLTSIIEGILFVNWYFPGSFAVITGALFSRGIVPVWIFIAVVFCGFSLGFFVDYLLGRYGFYRLFIRFQFFRNRLVSAQRALEKWAPVAFLIWYIHPQTGNFVATAAGIVRYSLPKFLFLSSFAGLFWITLWVGLVYMFGGVVLELIESYGYLVLMFALAAQLLVGYIKERKKIVVIS